MPSGKLSSSNFSLGRFSIFATKSYPIYPKIPEAILGIVLFISIRLSLVNSLKEFIGSLSNS